jgi:hypothetical protein
MKLMFRVLPVLLIAGAGATYVLLGPSVFLGGPSKATIIEVTRQIMVATAPDSTQSEAAKNAEVTPRGLCSPMDGGGYACLVDVQIAGGTANSFVAEIKKGDDGVWAMVP